MEALALFQDFWVAWFAASTFISPSPSFPAGELAEGVGVEADLLDGDGGKPGAIQERVVWPERGVALRDHGVVEVLDILGGAPGRFDATHQDVAVKGIGVWF